MSQVQINHPSFYIPSPFDLVERPLRSAILLHSLSSSTTIPYSHAPATAVYKSHFSWCYEATNNPVAGSIHHEYVLDFQSSSNSRKSVHRSQASPRRFPMNSASPDAEVRAALATGRTMRPARVVEVDLRMFEVEWR